MVRFSKNVTGYEMRVLIFSTTFAWNISHSKKKWASYDHKCMFTFMYTVPDILVSELEFSRQNLKKMHKYKISWKAVHLEPSCSMRTDRHTDMTKLIFAFGNYAKAPIMCTYTIHALWMYVIRKMKQEHDYWHTGRNRKWVQQVSRFMCYAQNHCLFRSPHPPRSIIR